jgi:hypothetical protein
MKLLEIVEIEERCSEVGWSDIITFSELVKEG